MAVAPASMAESIVILDDDEEESPQPSSSSAPSLSQCPANHIMPLKAQQPAPTHITQSPFATAKKDSHVLQAENQRLFTEFVEYCSALTQDVPEVMTFLHSKHTKACPEYLSSVEFRNTLGRCLTRAQANRSKTYVYINELCTVLKQHSAKRRQTLTIPDPKSSTSAATSSSASSVSIQTKDKRIGRAAKDEDDGVKREEVAIMDDEQPSTSGLQEEREEEEEKKTKRASRKQIAYLENLLKEYNDEIHRLQTKELSWDELETEDSAYIQEHRLKRKMMKIYDKLCELKGCQSLTGRVSEQRILYNSTRYPEINRKIERFINRPEVQLNPPDYTDLLQQVQRANERHTLCLTRKQVAQIAQEAFRETGNRLQERRHLDMVYNFGSHLTDVYKPAADPALSDTSLLRKLRANREVALSSLEEVITKYAYKQDDTEEQERNKRLERDRLKKEGEKPEEEEADGMKEENGEVEEEPEEEEDEDDVSSDPDIEEEIQASTLHAGPDDEEDEKEDGNEQVSESANEEGEGGEEEGNTEEEEEKETETVTNGLIPVSNGKKSTMSLLSDSPSSNDSPSQSEAMELDKGKQSSNSNLTVKKEAVVSSNHMSIRDSCNISQDATDFSPVAANRVFSPPSPGVIRANKDSCTEMCDTRSANGSPRATRGRKRKMEERESRMSHNITCTIISGSEMYIPLDMGVSSSPPPQAESSIADSPSQALVTSSQSTPPPKKNKVNVSTQCDPEMVIVLSDSE